MHLDVLDLRNFYYRSALGRSAQAIIRGQLTQWWPEAKGQTVVGFGFAAPLLRPFLKDARRVIALMPGPQGVMPWPPGQANVSVLCEEVMWPLDTGIVDKLVLMHALETSEDPTGVLDECYRVLGPGGRMLVIVPNRAGLWSRSDKTPFGYGRPYSLGQLEAQLKHHSFVVERSMSALYQPPSTKKVWRKMGGVLEKMGHKLPLVAAGGVLVVEVSKQIPARPRTGLGEAVKRPLRVLEGVGRPVVEPGLSSGRSTGSGLLHRFADSRELT